MTPAGATLKSRQCLTLLRESTNVTANEPGWVLLKRIKKVPVGLPLSIIVASTAGMNPHNKLSSPTTAKAERLVSVKLKRPTIVDMVAHSIAIIPRMVLPYKKRGSTMQ